MPHYFFRRHDDGALPAISFHDITTPLPADLRLPEADDGRATGIKCHASIPAYSGLMLTDFYAGLHTARKSAEVTFFL